MASVTPVYGWPYQGLLDPPHGPNLGEKGLLAVEATVAGVDAAVAGVAARTNLIAVQHKSSGNFTINAGANQIVNEVTFTAVSGATYLVEAVAKVSGTVAGSAALVNAKYAMGPTVVPADASGAGQLEYTVTATTTIITPQHLVAEVVAPASGQMTVGILVAFYTGSGTMTWFASNNNSTLRVTRG